MIFFISLIRMSVIIFPLLFCSCVSENNNNTTNNSNSEEAAPGKQIISTIPVIPDEEIVINRENRAVLFSGDELLPQNPVCELRYFSTIWYPLIGDGEYRLNDISTPSGENQSQYALFPRAKNNDYNMNMAYMQCEIKIFLYDDGSMDTEVVYVENAEKITRNKEGEALETIDYAAPVMYRSYDDNTSVYISRTLLNEVAKVIEYEIINAGVFNPVLLSRMLDNKCKESDSCSQFASNDQVLDVKIEEPYALHPAMILTYELLAENIDKSYSGFVIPETAEFSLTNSFNEPLSFKVFEYDLIEKIDLR